MPKVETFSSSFTVLPQFASLYVFQSSSSHHQIGRRKKKRDRDTSAKSNPEQRSTMVYFSIGKRRKKTIFHRLLLSLSLSHLEWITIFSFSLCQSCCLIGTSSSSFFLPISTHTHTHARTKPLHCQVDFFLLLLKNFLGRKQFGKSAAVFY